MVLASIHTFDPTTAGCESVTTHWQPCSDRAFTTLKKHVDSFHRVYLLNKGTHVTDPVATGRYPETYTSAVHISLGERNFHLKSIIIDTTSPNGTLYFATLVVAKQVDAVLAWDTIHVIAVMVTASRSSLLASRPP